MQIKYSPCNTKDKNTVIKYLHENAIEIDGEVFEFDEESVAWYGIAEQTNYKILEAHRNETGELYITVVRYYTVSCSEWDTGGYHEIKG